MGKQLGQGDIDALFAAAANATAASASDTETLVEQFDFSRTGQISNDQMRAISSVNDLFARNLMHTLGAWLRTPFKMKLVAGEQLPFSEFLERLSSPSYVCSIRLEPLGAVALLELELSTPAKPVRCAGRDSISLKRGRRTWLRKSRREARRLFPISA